MKRKEARWGGGKRWGEEAGLAFAHDEDGSDLILRAVVAMTTPGQMCFLKTSIGRRVRVGWTRQVMNVT